MIFSKEGFRYDQPEDFQGLDLEELGSEGAQAFIRHHPEWEEYRSEENKKLLLDYLSGLPKTRLNLELAFRDLKDELTKNPPETVPVVNNNRGIVQVIENTQAVWHPDADERAALAKLQDDISLSDHARKQRDQRLRLAAGRQRRELSSLPANADPTIINL